MLYIYIMRCRRPEPADLSDHIVPAHSQGLREKEISVNTFHNNELTQEINLIVFFLDFDM